jgi:hypothetical protein
MTRPTTSAHLSDSIQVVEVEHADRFAVLVDGGQLARVADPTDTFCIGVRWTEPELVPVDVVATVRAAYGVPS